MREPVKSENRKALPKFLLIMLASVLVGGVFGFAGGVLANRDLSWQIVSGVNGLLAAITPWGILVSSVVLLGPGWGLYVSAKKRFAAWDGEDETVSDGIEQTLNYVLLLTVLLMVLDFFFMAACAIYDSTILVVVQMVVSIALGIVLQQKVVDLTRQMNPEKKGSVYDAKFHKKWLESCDEAERAQIGQAAAKAYFVTSNACVFVWMALVVLSIPFEMSLLPAFVTLLLWGILQVTYTLECIRLGKRK